MAATYATAITAQRRVEFTPGPDFFRREQKKILPSPALHEAIFLCLFVGLLICCFLLQGIAPVLMLHHPEPG